MPAIDNFRDLGFDVVDLTSVHLPSRVVNIEALPVQVDPDFVTGVEHHTGVGLSL